MLRLPVNFPGTQAQGFFQSLGHIGSHIQFLLPQEGIGAEMFQFFRIGFYELHFNISSQALSLFLFIQKTDDFSGQIRSAIILQEMGGAIELNRPFGLG